ncbi:MAG: hypothetical protein HEEMFOPI_00004 [Holosporales bacterium]
MVFFRFFFLYVFFYGFLFSASISTAIDNFEKKLEDLSKSIESEACNRDAFAALFVKATSVLESLKIIYKSLNPQDQNTAALLKAEQYKGNLERIILKIKKKYKNCSTKRKKFSSIAPFTRHDQTGTKRIMIEEHVPPRYNDPTSDNFGQNEVPLFKK